MQHFQTPTAQNTEDAGSSLLAQIPNILRDRKWWIIVPAILGILGSIVAALVMPVLYTSQATMLVEAPQLPEEVLRQDDVDVVDRRIARIKQRITSRPDLIAMIERHNIYSDRRDSDSMSEIIADMRDAIVIEPTLAASSGPTKSETIAFTLSFSYPQAGAAQAVTQDLMERILRLDARGSVEQATNTVDFLEDRATRLETQIAELEGQINDIKARNGMSLSSGGMFMGGGSGSYDVQIGSLQRDNQTLIAQRRALQQGNADDPLVTAAERQLTVLRSIYSDTHPDVILARQRLAEARQLARNSAPSNSEVESLSRQIEFNNAQIAALQSAKVRDEGRLNSQIAAQARAPLVQQQIVNLERRLSGFTKQYEEVSNQLTDARTGVQAEDEQMTERLTVVEAPITPEEPSSPNFWIIFAIGIGGGLALGFGLGFAIELFLRPIRDPRTLESILGVAPIGVIPVVEVLEDRVEESARYKTFRFPRNFFKKDA